MTVRWATLLLVLAACSDVRDFRGTWTGPRVGDSPVLRAGVAPGAHATLAIDRIDTHGLAARLTIDGLVSDGACVSIEGAEADVLSGMSFDGSPLRVYLAFVAIADGNGEALVVVALYDPHRVEVRVLRGGAAPIYAIFSLAEAP